MTTASRRCSASSTARASTPSRKTLFACSFMLPSKDQSLEGTEPGSESNCFNTPRRALRASLKAVAGSKPVVARSSSSPVSLGSPGARSERSWLGSVHLSMACRSLMIWSPCTPNTAWMRASTESGAGLSMSWTEADKFSPNVNSFFDSLNIRSRISSFLSDSRPTRMRYRPLTERPRATLRPVSILRPRSPVSPTPSTPGVLTSWT